MMTQNNFDVLPTGKPHVSYSEVKSWAECSYRHNLQHIKKIDLSKPSIHLDIGTAVHAACENYLKTKVMDANITIKILEDAWKKNEGVDGFDEKSLQKAKDECVSILNDVPAFLDKEFIDWEFIAAEEQLYEVINPHTHAFKGFIDGVIKSKGKRGEDLVWLIDWKTSNRGWLRQKRQDKLTTAQLILYKSFWSQKHNIDLKNIRCAFIILKKQAKPGKHCEMFAVSAGDVSIKRNLKLVSDMVTSVKRGVSIKNRNSCTYCDYKGTEHCT